MSPPARGIGASLAGLRKRLSGGKGPAADDRSDRGPGGVPRKRNHWVNYGLPEDMTGKTFLDVGCWEGVNCAEAMRRGAAQAVGVDLCTSDELARNVEKFGFEFLQLDVLSEKWLELDDFDIVLCSGVLYHVENVISLLFRLRRVTRELLVLETATREIADESQPVLVFRPLDERGNPSNWWVPNEAGLSAMLTACGFPRQETAWRRARPKGARVCVHAWPERQRNYEAVLPRKTEAMSLAGGKRWHDQRKARNRRVAAEQATDGAQPQAQEPPAPSAAEPSSSGSSSA